MATSKSNKRAQNKSVAVIETNLDNVQPTDGQSLTGELLTNIDDQSKNEDNIGQDETGVVIDQEGNLETDHQEEEVVGQEENDQPQDQQDNQEDGQLEDDQQDKQEDGQVNDGQPDLTKFSQEQLIAMVTALAAQVQQQQANHTTGRLLSGTNSTTKADVARSIWDDEMTKNNPNGNYVNCPVRSVVISRLMVEAKLTKAGAATYFQNMKKKAGFVNSK